MEIKSLYKFKSPLIAIVTKYIYICILIVYQRIVLIKLIYFLKYN